MIVRDTIDAVGRLETRVQFYHAKVDSRVSALAGQGRSQLDSARDRVASAQTLVQEQTRVLADRVTMRLQRLRKTLGVLPRV